MRRRKIWLNIVFGFIILLSVVSFGAIIKPNNSTEVIIAVISLDVALFALYISLRTFYSIDEVNAISRMDGNVMENPRYQPNILRAVFRFPQIGFTEASEALMTHMEILFKDNDKQSGAHLADNVQEVADMLVLVPFFIQTSDDNASAIHLQRVSTLLTTMKERVENFKEISDGSCKLLEETVSLIESVFFYQKMTVTGESDPSKLLEIRGSIFINPVTAILYNNYLGLYYLQRATSIICSHQTGLSLRQMIECAHKCTPEDKSMALVYARKASDSFKCAKKSIGDDMIWTAFVCFNISRVEYMIQLINETFGETTSNEWESYINESIRSWITSNKIIAEHFSSKIDSSQISWLQQAMISQENKVRLSKIVFQMMKKLSLTDYNGNAWVEQYGKITETAFFKNIPEKDPQKRTDDLVDDIREMLKTTPLSRKKNKKE